MTSGLARVIKNTAETIYAVPGYPITPLIEETGAELVINEKVALEYALGDSLCGKRSCVLVKHVGMNVLADTLVHATAQGLHAGVVVVVGDDPLAQGSQVVQDCRYYGVLAACPVIELVSSDSINEAFCVSEQFSRVSILPIVPDDLQRPMQDLPHKAGMSRSGSLADPDCTMYGRAVRAYASVPDMIKAGYLPYPIAPLNPDAAPVSRSKRGRSRGLCAGCPFQSLFDHLQERRISVISDTGCSLISMFPPYSFGLANYGMGSSVGVASHSTGVALIGDYALLHSGIQALMDLHAKGHPVLCIVLQNRCMGTTGRQPVPEILPYVAFADPVVCIASEHDKISGLLVPGTKLRVIVIQGACPEEGCI